MQKILLSFFFNIARILRLSLFTRFKLQTLRKSANCPPRLETLRRELRDMIQIEMKAFLLELGLSLDGKSKNAAFRCVREQKMTLLSSISTLKLFCRPIFVDWFRPINLPPGKLKLPLLSCSAPHLSTHWLLYVILAMMMFQDCVWSLPSLQSWFLEFWQVDARLIPNYRW